MSKTRLSLSHEDRGLAVTRDEFADADVEQPWRYERAHGRLVVMVPPGYEHHWTLNRFRDPLVVYRLQHPETVEDIFQESWITVDAATDRLADIAVYLRSAGPGSVTDPPQYPERIPDLIFEVVSAGPENRRRDYEEKREEYRRAGVREYVIVDRFEHRLTVLRLRSGEYVETVLGPQDTYTTRLLPGLEIPLSQVI